MTPTTRVPQLLLLSLTLASGTFTSCKQLKPTEGSKSKDVDAVLEGRNDAQGDGDAAPTARPARLCGVGARATTGRAALESAHGRLPARLKQEFPLEGRDGTPVLVLVGDQAELNKICDGATTAQKDQIAVPENDETKAEDWRACFAPSTKDDAATAVPVVYLLDDVDAVYGNLVATAVWAYSGHWIDQVIPMALDKMTEGDAKTQLTQLAKVYGDSRADLARAYLKFLDDAAVVDAYKTRFKATSKEDLAGKGLFRNFLLAETAEEYYCDTDPKRPLMTESMRPVLDAFAPIALHLGTAK